MASAIQQLIAQQQGPNPLGALGSAAQTLSSIQATQMAPLQLQQEQQRLEMGKQQLSALGQQQEQAKRAQLIQLGANASLAIKKAPPDQRAALYAQALQQASSMGIDVSHLPQQYDDQTQRILDWSEQQVYGGEQFKTDEAIRQAKAKPENLSTLAGKYTPESIAQYQQTKNYADLKPVTETLTPYQAADLQIKRDRLDKDIAGDEQPFTSAAIENAAARYNIDGTLPPMGMGKTGAQARSAILNKAAELAAAAGKSGDQQRIDQIGNKANTSALAQLQKQQTMVGAFEKNFVRNADISMELSDKVDRSGIPVINRWLNAGKRSLAGDPELSAYDASLKATSNEYAKIISGSMGNTALAEGEIKKIEGLLNAAQTPEQVKAVINLMKRETQNRIAGFEEEKAALRASMTNSTSKSKSPKTIQTDDDYNALPSGAEFIAPDGSHRRKP